MFTSNLTSEEIKEIKKIRDGREPFVIKQNKDSINQKVKFTFLFIY